MTKSKHDLANVTISISVDFDKKIAIFDLNFKIVTALMVRWHIHPTRGSDTSSLHQTTKTS